MLFTTLFRGKFIVLSMLLYGCTSAPVELDTARHEATITEDRQRSQNNAAVPKTIKLSVDEALDIAVHENLDARVSALEYIGAQDSVTLEKIRALPAIEYTQTRHGRSNEPASSSLSILTGDESLEPSVSTERYRSTRDITLNWNLIDVATVLLEAKTASDRAEISKERHKKVIQNIHRDVYAAYWRVWADDKTRKQTHALINDTKKHMRNIDAAAKDKLISQDDAIRRKTPYLETISALKTLQNEAGLAQIELKSLLNLPQSTTVILTSNPQDIAGHTGQLLKADIETLELAALRSRPEMRESFIEKNISIRDTKKEIVRSMPGAELFFALNRDTNKFLVNESWRSYSIGLVQNIANLLSLPDRYLIARKNEDLNEARRVTLSAAIIAQVHIARHNLVHTQDLYTLASSEQKSAQYQAFSAQKKQHIGNVSKGEVLLSRLQAQEKTLQSYQSLAAAQDAYAALINTLGHEVGERVSITDLKAGTS